MPFHTDQNNHQAQMAHFYDHPPWQYTVFTQIWLAVSPGNFMLPSYSMTVYQFPLSIPFVADILYWLAQPKFLDTRGGFVA